MSEKTRLLQELHLITKALGTPAAGSRVSRSYLIVRLQDLAVDIAINLEDRNENNKST